MTENSDYKLPLSDKILLLIENMKEMINTNMTDTEYIGYVDCSSDFINFDDTLNCRAIALSLERDERVKGWARIILALLHPTKNADLSMTLIRGSKFDLLNYISDIDAAVEIERGIFNISDSMVKYI